MSPIGPYPDFQTCVLRNSDKSNPEAFCAWLEHRITGAWPGQMSEALPAEAWNIYLQAYSAALDDGKGERQAARQAEKVLDESGWVRTYLGWERYFQAPKMRDLVNVPVFAAGRWTDSQGETKTWSIKELDTMVEAFNNKVVDRVPLKLGHSSDGFNNKIAEALEVPVEVVTGEHGHGQMAIGWLSNIQRVGDKLIGAFTNVPEVIADMIEGGLYHAVSAEIDEDMDTGKSVITGVALLGVEDPAVDVAELDLALVFGKAREHTHRVIFTKGVQMHEKVAGVVGTIKENLDKIVKLFKEGDEIPEYVQAYADEAFQGNVDALIRWAGQVGFDVCVSSLSGKPGITDPTRLCGWLKARSGQHQEGDTDMDLQQFVMALAALLELGEDATPESIIEALKAKLAPPPPGEGGEPPPAPAAESNQSQESELPEAVKTEFASMRSTIKTLQDKNREFERERRVNKYNKVVSGLDAIATEADQAVKWADLEEKAGEEVVNGIVEQFKAANKAAKEAGLLKPIGHSQGSGEEQDPFEKEVEEYAKANNTTFEKALVILSEQKPKEYAEYHERVRTSITS